MKAINYLKKKLPHYCVKSLLVIIMIPAFLFKGECQEQVSTGTPKKSGSYEETFSTSRIGLAQSVMTTPQGEFHFVILHRFTELKGGFSTLFGLDGAMPRIGVEYGITDWLSASLGRSLNYVKTYDLGLKAVFLKQKESGSPVSISYYVSAIDTVKSNYPGGHNSFGSRLSFVNQLFIATNQGIFSFQVSPLWIHSNYEIRTHKALDIFAIDLAGRIRFSEKIGLFTEYINILTNEDFTKTNPLTVGLDINTGGHQFQLFLSNNQGTNEKVILTNTFGKWSKGHVFFGFNITRVFHPRMD